MKRLILIVVCCLMLTGCWRYGEGQTVGYVTTTESGIIWDLVWIRAELESSETNAYCINKANKELKKALLETSKKKQRIELSYYNHIGIASIASSIGEVISFEIIKDD